MVPTGAASSRRSRTDFLATKWPRLFFTAVGIQAVVCLAFEAFVFAKFQTNVKPEAHQAENDSQSRTILTFLALFILAFVYELVLTWDALRLKNTIQVIGLCIANLIFLVYTALQIDQIGDAVIFLQNRQVLKEEIWSTCKPFLIAIPAIFAFVTILLGYMTWRLYQEFAWDILKHIGADYRMKKRFLHYQIYIALLKFDFFFFLGFTVQFLVIVTGKTDIELGLTAAAIPITIAILLLAAFFTQRENKVGMCAIIVTYFGGLAYFFFKLVRIYQPGHKQHYAAVQKSLTAFAVLTILLIILTIVNAFICMSNFGQGLKEHLTRPRSTDLEKGEQNMFPLHESKPTLATRMTID